MLFDKFKSTLNEQFSKCTDEELLSLEPKLREDGERDAAEVVSKILLSRRNRPLLAKNEYRNPIGFTDEHFTDESW